MTEPNKFRGYLLGLITDEAEREQIETRLLDDEGFLELMQVEEDELIDDLVDETLGADERRAFEANFTVTPERRKKIEFARAARLKFRPTRQRASVDAEKRPNVWKRIRAFFAMNRLVTAAAFGSLLVACLFAGWFFLVRPADESAFSASLNRAFENERPLNARITDLDYAPFSERRGPKEILSDENALRRAENIARDAVFDKETAENLHDLGKLQIAKREFAEAKKTLEKALAKKPDDPTILNELGIAELIAADNAKSGGEQLRLVATALEHFDKATRLSPKFAEAWFNRALAIGKLNVPGQEAAAWRDYLNLDSTSKWADEARSRLTQLESQTVVPITAAELVEEFLAAYRQRDDETAFRRLSENKEMITGKLVFQQLAFLFADAEPDSDRSKELLSAMHYAADLELRKTGDKFWKHLADYYTQNGAAKRSQLKIAQDEVRAAYKNLLANQYEIAKTRFESAKLLFDQAGNDGESLIIDYWIAYLDQQESKISESRRRLVNASAVVEKKGFTWLNSQYLAWLGKLEFFDDNQGRQIEYDVKTLKMAERHFDNNLRKKLCEGLGIAYLHLGAGDRSLEFAALGLSIDDQRYFSGRQHYHILILAAKALVESKGYAAARILLNESLRLNLEVLNDSSFDYQTFLLLGQIEVLIGDFPKAIDYYERSRATLSLLSENTRPRHTAYLDLLTAHAFREQDRCDEALPFYERSARFHDSSEAYLDRFDNHRGLLMCHVKMADHQKAAAETRVVLDQLDRYREIIRTESVSNSFFEGVQQIYDTLIGYELSRNNHAKALEYSEASRSRSLLDMLSQPVLVEGSVEDPEIKLPDKFIEPMAVKNIQSRVPTGTQLLIYSVLKTKTAIWVVSQDQISVRIVDISKEDLDAFTKDFLSSITNPGSFSSSNRIAGRKLASVLIEPVRSLIDPERPVTIVPDKTLSKIPFGALPHNAENRFLAHQFAFQYAPSAAVFVIASETALTMDSNSAERLLAVGDPMFDREEFPNYPKLEGAKTEANGVAELYPASVVLNGPEATRAEIDRHIGSADVFHFAGHYVYDPGSPLRSGMLVAGKGGESIVRNRSLVVKRKGHLRLAVLSACTTGSEKVINGEGMLGAARVFLAQGVPQVVASHWEVDSQATAGLMISFHRFRRSSGFSTARAMQQAQLSLIESPNSQLHDPYYWAAFFVIGGTNEG